MFIFHLPITNVNMSVMLCAFIKVVRTVSRNSFHVKQGKMRTETDGKGFRWQGKESENE